MDGGQVVEVSALLIPSEFLNINSIIILKVGIFFSNLFNYMFFPVFLHYQSYYLLTNKKMYRTCPSGKGFEGIFIP
jgi:uncharacterized membrane protein YgaE (UPF0421/DUF939 family)